MKDVNDVMKMLDAEIENLPQNAVKKYVDVVEKAKESGMTWKQIVAFFELKIGIKVKVQSVKDVYYEKYPEKKPVKKQKKEKKEEGKGEGRGKEMNAV